MCIQVRSFVEIRMLGGGARVMVWELRGDMLGEGKRMRAGVSQMREKSGEADMAKDLTVPRLHAFVLFC